MVVILRAVAGSTYAMVHIGGGGSCDCAQDDSGVRVPIGAVPRATEFQRGSAVVPINARSIARAAWRPSRIAQTTSDWPRRTSPAAQTLSTLVL
jgi:hypothetical protein